MQKIVLSLLVLLMVTGAYADSYTFKSKKSGRVYGPFEVHDGATIPLGGVSFELRKLSAHAVHKAQAKKEKLPPPVRSKPYTIQNIYRNMFDLEGEIVKVAFAAHNVKQISKDEFTCNLGSGSHVAVVKVPAQLARKWWGGKTYKHPKSIYARVEIGDLVESFGTGRSEKGVVLIPLGRRLYKRSHDDVTYLW